MLESCPYCQSTEVTAGDCDGFRGFWPDGLRLLHLEFLGLRLAGRFCICLNCGLLWSAVSVDELHSMIRRLGKDEIKQMLSRVEGREDRAATPAASIVAPQRVGWSWRLALPVTALILLLTGVVVAIFFFLLYGF